jgi:phage-related protein (TIGR01555 family)
MHSGERKHQLNQAIQNIKSVYDATHKAANQFTNARVYTQGGMSTGCDLGNDAQPVIDSRYFFLQQLIFSEELYYTDWQAKKIVEIPVNDMLREGWIYEGLSVEQNNQLQAEESRIGFLRYIRQALRLERLHGGCAIYMGIKGHGPIKTEDPVDLNDLVPGDLEFLNVIPRIRISRYNIDTNPLNSTYGRPEWYIVNGSIVHRSRLLLFDGDPILDVRYSSYAPWFLDMNDGMGIPILTSIFDDLERSTGSRQAAFHLLQRASCLVLSADIESLMETKEGNKKLGELQEIVRQLSMYRAAILTNSPGSKAEVSTITSQFGAVPELLMSYLQVISAASDIPAIRFIGEAPGGLNASGTSDLENYYNMINAKQRNHLEPHLRKLLDVLGRSLFGPSFNIRDVKIEFAKLWNLNEVQEADVRRMDVSSLLDMQKEGTLSAREVLDEAKARHIFLTDPSEVPQENWDKDLTDDVTSSRSEIQQKIKELGQSENTV